MTAIGGSAAYAWLLSPAGRADLLGRWAFVPATASFASAVTGLLVHENLLHAAANLIALWLFGENVEDRLGRVRFLILLLVGACAGTLAEIWAAPDSHVPIVGTSGAVAGVIAAHLALMPKSRLLVAIPVDLVEVPSVAYAACWFVLQIVGGLGHLPWSGLSPAIWTSVGGAAAGALFARVFDVPHRWR